MSEATLQLTGQRKFLRVPTGAPTDNDHVKRAAALADAYEAALEDFEAERAKLAGDPGDAARQRRQELKAEAVTLLENIRGKGPSREKVEEEWARATEPVNRFRAIPTQGLSNEDVRAMEGELRSELRQLRREGGEDGPKHVMARLEEAIRDGEDLTVRAAVMAPASLGVLTPEERTRILERHLEVRDPETHAELQAQWTAVRATEWNHERAVEALREITGDPEIGRKIDVPG